MKAQDARNNTVAEQGRKTQEFTQQSAQYVEAARKHYDSAEKLNIPDYQEKKTHLCNWFRLRLGPTLCACSGEVRRAHVSPGCKPEKARQLLAMDGQSALIELLDYPNA